ncbi:M56 family metallopeptidase [Pirellulaceae bacterium SH449]
MNMELMDRLFVFAETWMWLVLLATWRALPILILVTGIALAFRRKLSPSLHAMLLTIVVVRLLIPISIGSPLSVHTPIDNWFSTDSKESINSHQQRDVHDHVNDFLPNTDVTDTHWTRTEAQAQPSVSIDDLWNLTLSTALVVVIFVSTLLLFRSVISHIRFALKLRSCRVLDEQRLIDLLLRECDSLAVGRRPNVREVPSLVAPAVFGLFRHTICFPPCLIEKLSEQELRWVIRHELAHIRRYDIPVAIIASIAGALHWFNPVVWLIVKRLRAAMEAAADRLALQNVPQSEILGYGELLLRFAEISAKRKNLPTLGLISIASGKDLKRRVELLIQNHKPTGLPTRILSASVVTAIAGLGLTDARDASDQEMPARNLVARDSIDLYIDPTWADPWGVHENDGPLFVATYDVTSIFETMPESLSGGNMTTEEQFSSWLRLSPSLKGRFQVVGSKLSADLCGRQHRLLSQTLDIWKKGEPEQIVIETRFIQTTLRTANSIDWTGRRIEGLTVKGLGPALAARIEDRELAQLVRTVSTDSKGKIMFAPKVTVYEGQTASIADQTQRQFVTGVDLKAGGIMLPVFSMVEEGLSFVLTPKAGHDDSVNLDFKVKISSIGKVSYAHLPIGDYPHSGFLVQVPATEQYEVSSSVRLAAGESVVVAIPRVFDNEHDADAETTVLVAFTPRMIERQLSSSPK